MALDTPCPVCGYDLQLNSLDDLVESCPSCGFEFTEFHIKLPYSHFNPENFFVRISRNRWEEAHLTWQSDDIPKPPDWDPIKQMQRIGVHLADSFAEWADENPVIAPENNEKFLQIALRK